MGMGQLAPRGRVGNEQESWLESCLAVRQILPSILEAGGELEVVEQGVA